MEIEDLRQRTICVPNPAFFLDAKALDLIVDVEEERVVAGRVVGGANQEGSGTCKQAFGSGSACLESPDPSLSLTLNIHVKTQIF